jgi:hypothetical protein
MFYPVGFGQQDIVKDGLVLWLDANDKSSYPGTGTIWTDLSRGGSNATLYNGPTFNSSNGGSIVFDGTNDYAETIRTNVIRPDYVTMCTWVKYTGAQSLSFIGGCGNTNVDGYFLSVSSTQFRFNAGNGNLISGGAPILNFGTRNSNINYLCGTFDGTTIRGYINGILGASLNQTVTGPLTYPTTGGSPILGGMYLGSLENNLGVARYWTGNIYQTSIYNRALSATEVLQNFNSTRARFGI